MRTVAKRILWAVGIVLALVAGAIGTGIGLYLYSTRPISDAQRLADGSITAVVTGHYGPIARLAYLFELPGGGVGLVDTGDDPEATRIEAALERLGKTRASVRAILATHSHADHAGAVLAFPEAEVYGMAPDIESLRRRRERAGAVGETIAVRSGEPFEILGLAVEGFAVPGHTAGSAAYLVHGVLFVGDAAHGLRDGTFGVNEMFSEDAAANVQSLKSLAERLRPRRMEIRQVAFGHAGPLEGLDSMLTWASGSE